MKNIKIYQVFHKNAQTLQSRFVEPIQVGTGETLSCECVRDNQCDNISSKNGSYCELTAQYWAWKNDKISEYLGIMHYRRLFDFSNIRYELDINGVIVDQTLGLDFQAKYGYFDENIELVVSKYDIVLPKLWSVKNVGFKSLKEHYIKAPYHIESHLQITQDAVKELYPEYLSDFQIVLDGHEGYFTNMFIMKRDYFERYSQWLFDILSLVESKVSLDGLNIQEKRVFGYLSERLLNVWIAHEKRTNSSLKIGTLDRVFVENTDVKESYNYVDLPTSNVVSAVIASDNNYVPHLGALIKSIFTFFDSKYFLTHQLDFIYDKNTVNKVWLDFLNKVLPDKDTQKTLQQAIGYLFIKDLKLEKVIFLYGIGSNGKSVIFEIIKGILSVDMMTNYSLASLTNHLGYQLADLNNKLINYGTDISMKNVDLAIFKQIASGEPIGTRQIREKAFTMKNYAKLIFNVNKLDDADVENTHGFGRRLLFIPFEQFIDKQDQDKNLHKKILENKTGVMNWIIEGIEEVLKNEEIFVSEKCENFLDNFKRESSPIQLFLEDSHLIPTTQDTNEIIDFQQMYEMYREFCKKQGEKAVAQRNLNADLKRLGYEFKRKKQGNVWFLRVN